MDGILASDAMQAQLATVTLLMYRKISDTN